MFLEQEKLMTDKLIIFDTTLRDGEQSPGASMTKDEKLRIARQLERLKVDVIEAGFAASSNGDFEACRRLPKPSRTRPFAHWHVPTTATFPVPRKPSRGQPGAYAHCSLRPAALHMEKKLRMTPDQVFEQAKQSVRFARNLVAISSSARKMATAATLTFCAVCWRR
jgi:2-isopropylmalate synthase